MSCVWVLLLSLIHGNDSFQVPWCHCVLRLVIGLLENCPQCFRLSVPLPTDKQWLLVTRRVLSASGVRRGVLGILDTLELPSLGRPSMSGPCGGTLSACLLLVLVSVVGWSWVAASVPSPTSIPRSRSFGTDVGPRPLSTLSPKVEG